MADWKPPTQDRADEYFKELNNWGRWGHDDQRGTANLITAAKRAQATDDFADAGSELARECHAASAVRIAAVSKSTSVIITWVLFAFRYACRRDASNQAL